MLCWEVKYNFWSSKPSGVWPWHWTLQALHKQSHFCDRSPLTPNIISCDLRWWQKDWLEPAHNILMDSSTEWALTPGKEKKNKPKHLEQCETHVFIGFLSVSCHIAFRHTQKEVTLITQLFEKTAKWQLENTQLAPGTPDYGHPEQSLRTSLDLVLTNTQVCAFYLFLL